MTKLVPLLRELKVPKAFEDLEMPPHEKFVPSCETPQLSRINLEGLFHLEPSLSVSQFCRRATRRARVGTCRPRYRLPTDTKFPTKVSRFNFDKLPVHVPGGRRDAFEIS